MLELSPENSLDYLTDRGILSAGEPAEVRWLEWGVSNVVLRIVRPAAPDFVVKQSREKLRTAVEWRSRLERIHREAEVQRALAALLPAGVVPRVLFEDRANHLYGMEAVAADHVVWKQALLEGRADERVAIAAAECLATVHRDSAGSVAQSERKRWSDVAVFDELRLDPFYRFTAARRPELREPLLDLVESTLKRADRLVLADFSPKNILLTSSGISLVDFETAHFGDPAFDSGFFLSHLLLKTLRLPADRNPILPLARAFWTAYRAEVHTPDEPPEQIAERSRRTVQHTAACLIARIDGKSPVDYLTEPQQEFVRRTVRGLFQRLPTSPEELFDRWDAARRESDDGTD